jgi:diadenosine tetraphosphate (Ap4A) HIT family hydrolase
MEKEELMKLSPRELVDLGICPTRFNRECGGAIYGDNSDKMLFEDEEIECFFVGNPRAPGHMCISTMQHYHDMSEAPDCINEKVIRFTKAFMNIIREVFGCERVYLCTMCDGPNNHYHVQLIPRYSYEKRGSGNFVKARSAYVPDAEKLRAVRAKIAEYDKSIKVIREKCVTCDHFKGDPENLDGHYERLRLDGYCWGYENTSEND